MLKLLDKDIAARFWSPQADCDENEIVKEFVSRGWSEKDARNHMQEAIKAGAYGQPKYEERPKVSEHIGRAKREE